MLRVRPHASTTISQRFLALLSNKVDFLIFFHLKFIMYQFLFLSRLFCGFILYPRFSGLVRLYCLLGQEERRHIPYLLGLRLQVELDEPAHFKVVEVEYHDILTIFRLGGGGNHI